MYRITVGNSTINISDKSKIISSPPLHVGHYVIVLNNNSVFCRDCSVTIAVGKNERA